MDEERHTSPSRKPPHGEDDKEEAEDKEEVEEEEGEEEGDNDTGGRRPPLFSPEVVFFPSDDGSGAVGEAAWRGEVGRRFGFRDVFAALGMVK